MALAKLKIDSPLGPMYAVGSEIGLRSLYWDKPSVPDATENSSEEKVLQKVESQMQEYFAGRLHQFDLPLDLIGTDFQKNVWKKLLEIPYGKTISYQELAKRVGNAKASRAVGSANGKNPICVIVPCHRVIASDGGLGGYSGGLHVKSFLLDLEKSNF